MKRITHYNKEEKYYDVKKAYLADIDERGGDGEAWVNTYNAYQKLGELEDIENELGIDLITLFKAINNGVYFKTDNEISFCSVWLDDIDAWDDGFCTPQYFWKTNRTDLNNKEFYFRDYGKTWSLTEKELKND